MGACVVDLFSIGAGVGALLPPVCRLSDWHSLGGGCLAVASELPSLATGTNCSTPLAALRLGAMHQEGEGYRTKAVGIIMIHLKSCSLSISLGHEHFAIAREQTFVDHVIELATIACRHVEIRGQVSYTELGEDVKRFAIAIELEIGVHLCNLDPGFKVSETEKVARLVDTNQLSLSGFEVLQCNVDLRCCMINASSQIINDRLEIVCTIEECTIVLHLGGCSETTEDRVLAITNRTLAVVINDSKRLAEHSTRAGLACRQVEDQGAGAQLGVALGEGEHGSRVVDLFSIGGRWCPLVVLVDSVPTGTGSEVYSPVWVILDSNPEEIATIVRTKEHTVLFNLLDNTLWVVVHQVSESVLRFVTLRGGKCKVKHDRIVLTCSL